MKHAPIGIIEAKEKNLRCACGHARSSHRQASHKRHELGACKGSVRTPIGESACPCHEYDPVEAK